MLLIKISKRGKVTNIEKPDINFIKKNKNISMLNTWKYNNYDFVIYGCENGNAGEENKYDLPPPIDCELYFNDLYIIKMKNDKLENLNIEEYNIFYNDCFGGFEDIQSTDDEEEVELSEHTSDRDFIDDENISIGSETNELDLEELSSFTSDEDYVDEEKISFEEDDIGELSSIEITVSSCDEDDIENDLDDLDDIENDLDVDTE
jgi:hypothetical protein